MKTLTQTIRNTGICLITAVVIFAPGIAHAGWLGSPKPVLNKVTQTVRTGISSVQNEVTQTVSTGVSNIQGNADGIGGRLGEMYERLDDSRPLVDALKNGKMMQQLTEVVQYLNESQQEYQAFADNGVYLLRQDIKDLAYTVASIGDMLNLDGKLGDQLHKASALVDRIPAVFLFALARSGIDKRLQDMLARLGRLGDDLVLFATLPPESEVFLYPEQYRDDICPLVNDRQTKVQLAVLNARIDTNIWAIDTVSGLIPEDLDVSATVVGGGGATVSKFPPQYIFKAMKTILSAVKLRMDNYKSIADSMCASG
jgi:hypothetical protein